MAIKWKSKYTVIAWLLLICFGLNNIIGSSSLTSRYAGGNYFQSNDFRWRMEDFISTLYSYKIVSEEDMTVTQSEIEEYRNRFGDLTSQLDSINEQYEEKINDAKERGNEELEAFFTTERDTKLADITKNFTDDNHVIEKIKAERAAERIEENAWARDNYNHFVGQGVQYYLRNTDTNQIYTNIDIVEGLDVTDVLAKQDLLFQEDIENLHLSTSFHSLEGIIAISATSNSMFQQEAAAFQGRQITYYLTIGTGIIALLAAAILYKRKLDISDRELLVRWQKKLAGFPIDVRVIVLLFSALAYLLISRLYFESVIYQHVNVGVGTVLFITIGSSFLFGMGLQGKQLFDELRNWEEWKTQWRQSLMVGMIANRSVLTRAIMLGMVLVGTGLGVPLAMLSGEMGILLYLLFFFFVSVPTIIYLFKKVFYLRRIANNFTKIIEGESVPDLKVKGRSNLATLASNVNTIKEEIKFTKKEQVKSERLKTELITNVSHDLRTPLTSIITYTDLLKQEEMTEDERKTYVEIIDRKSKRLKMLIDDLFEVSKMASGNMELQKNKVDIVQLLQQSLGEYDEKIAQSSLQFRVTYEKKPLYAMVDGPKIWRVFDNIINNVLKYSLDHTRVYVMTAETAEAVTITFKNVSKYELGENVDELFQRFKRGDVSRHTEGSGLGLAIAQSIIDLHGGNLQLEVDGDLFKVVIQIPR